MSEVPTFYLNRNSTLSLTPEPSSNEAVDKIGALNSILKMENEELKRKIRDAAEALWLEDKWTPDEEKFTGEESQFNSLIEERNWLVRKCREAKYWCTRAWQLNEELKNDINELNDALEDRDTTVSQQNDKLIEINTQLHEEIRNLKGTTWPGKGGLFSSGPRFETLKETQTLEESRTARAEERKKEVKFGFVV